MIPERTHSKFTLHVHFRQQQFKSWPVPCSCEPDIEEGFLLELSKHSSSHPDYDNDRMMTPNDAFSITDSVHLVLVKTNCRSDEIDLVGSSYLEWRCVCVCVCVCARVRAHTHEIIQTLNYLHASTHASIHKHANYTMVDYLILHTHTHTTYPTFTTKKRM